MFVQFSQAQILVENTKINSLFYTEWLEKDSFFRLALYTSSYNQTHILLFSKSSKIIKAGDSVHTTFI